jgi:hypothetical protein
MMQWQRTEAVQTPCGLFLNNDVAIEKLLCRLSVPSEAWSDLRIVHGSTWLIIHGPVLPYVAEVTAFYMALSGWYLPVGIDFAVPVHVREELLSCMLSEHAFQPPALVIPEFGNGETVSRKADVFLLSRSVPVSRIVHA